MCSSSGLRQHDRRTLSGFVSRTNDASQCPEIRLCRSLLFGTSPNTFPAKFWRLLFSIPAQIDDSVHSQKASEHSSNLVEVYSQCMFDCCRSNLETLLTTAPFVYFGSSAPCGFRYIAMYVHDADECSCRTNEAACDTRQYRRK